MKFLVNVIALVIGLGICDAQPSAYNLSMEEGLPSHEVYNVFQDSRGFLWFGTDNGVCRFDGRDLDLYHVKDGLTDPVVFEISEDPDGRIWFRTFSGKLSYYEKGRIYTYKYNDRIKAVNRSRIVLYTDFDSLGGLTLTNSSHLSHIDSAGKLDSLWIPPNHIRIREMPSGRILVAGAMTTPVMRVKWLLFDGGRYPVPPAKGESFYHMSRAVSWKGKLYFSTGDTLYEFDGTRVKVAMTADRAIIYLYVDRKEDLWIGYIKGGVERYADGFAEPNLKLVREKSVTSVLFDHEGGLWLTTLEDGAYYIPNLASRLQLSRGEAKITSVVAGDGQVITGDVEGNIRIYAVETGRLVRSKNIGDGSMDDLILSMFRTRKGDLLISSGQYLRVFDKSLNLKKKITLMRSAIAQRKNGNIIAANTSIYEMDENAVPIRILNTKLRYRSILIDDSLIFLSGRSGLHVNDLQFNPVRDEPAFESAKIVHLHNLNDSIVFLGTLGSGFFLLNKHTWQSRQFNEENDFHANNIYSVMIKDSTLWIATEKGIAVAPLRSVINHQFEFEFLTKWNGLLENKINFLVDGGTNVWACSDFGISIIPYESMRFANKRPLFVLEGLAINHQKVDGLSNRVLHHENNDILIKFRSISFNNRNILTRYRITPKEPWNYTDSRQILLTSLAPGTYKFELQYSTDNYKWHPALATMPFVIGDAWWNQWYTRLLAIALLFSASYLYVKYQRSVFRERNHYLRIINEHQQKLLQSEIVTRERERNRISKELHDRVGTNLTAIKLSVSRLLKSHEEPLAADIEEQFQVAIREIKEIIYGLTPPSLERYGLFTGLKNYVGKLSRSIPIDISVKTFGKESLDQELNILIFRVLQELITNTIKHSYAKHITIHISSFDDMINVVYEDDGVGFSIDPSNHGLGLDSVESRIQSVNGTLRFESGTFGVSYSIDIPTATKKEVV